MIRPNAWIRSYYKDLIWQLDTAHKTLAITFDDGPHPEVTPYVLELLKEKDIKSTFFCVGQNAENHPDLIAQIKSGGHQLGNHTYNHLKGWKTSTSEYCNNVVKANNFTSEKLFRPPYGKITKAQAKWLLENNYDIIMWSVLTYDFDPSIDIDKIMQKIKKRTKRGSIVTFHDSAKAFPQLKKMLPELLDHWIGQGFSFQTL